MSPASSADDTAEVTAAMPKAEQRGERVLTGRVVSDRMNKTITVLVERVVRHQSYGKYLRRSTKLLAHDESGSAKLGDKVTITPCRPLSRRKSWRLLAVIERAAS